MINKMTVRYIKLNDKAQVPTYGTEFAAGADLYAAIEEDRRRQAAKYVHLRKD